MTMNAKAAVREFWDQASCGEVYAVGDDQRRQFEAQAEARYELEPYIMRFARFSEGCGQAVLEIGVGMGADHLQWAQAKPARLAGIDLTERAIRFTEARIGLYGEQSELQVGDAENLPFPDDSFDIVYSWGVLHHSPDTQRAINEVRRVLRPGGRAAIMIYHRPSLVGAMLWLRYGAWRGHSFRQVFGERMESPGTKAYTRAETQALFQSFRDVKIEVELSVGDLLLGAAGQRHQGPLLRIARALWPRKLVQKLAPQRGLFLLITAIK